jgi:Ala-tRNA(Pro) deacylase
MAISARLRGLLSKNRIRYTSHRHPTAYTAQEIAAAQHVSGKQLAKCVLVNTDKGFFLAVLSAVELIDFAKLKTLVRAKKLKLAGESDIKRLFPDVEVGAMSVFGNLYNVPTVVDKALTASEQIVCNAGSHTKTITLRYRDFETLVKPKVGTFGLPVGKAAKGKAKSKKT